MTMMRPRATSSPRTRRRVHRARPAERGDVVRGKTKPPKPFTEATLLAAMEHARAAG